MGGGGGAVASPPSPTSAIPHRQKQKTCPGLSSEAGFIIIAIGRDRAFRLADEARANNAALLANRSVRISHWTRGNRPHRRTGFSGGLGGLFALLGTFVALATAVATAARAARVATAVAAAALAATTAAAATATAVEHATEAIAEAAHAALVAAA